MRHLAITMMASAIIMSSMNSASGQATTACTTSLLTSFTPCFNFLTGSTNGGGSPTAACCSSLGALIDSSAQCACLVVTGNVPLSLPINRTLAITLPRLCKSKPVPLRCQATVMPLPGPGPIAYSPGLPPLPSTGSNTGSDTRPDATQPLAPSSELPAAPEPASSTNQGQRPFLIPSSAVKLYGKSQSMMMVMVIGILLWNI